MSPCRGREVSVREVRADEAAQIARGTPKVNAVCTLLPERAMKQAARADENLVKGATPGPLYGLPIAIKDLVDTKGIRTTYGSPIYKDFVPDKNALVVERLESAGAIVIGKTNVPEFGAGSHTFNPVYGMTRNPYDLTKTCGGSSGGGAVSLACGMTPIADGSDLGGSIRNPPSFNNVVGLRPSPGRIPRYPNTQPWNSLPVLGPMARCAGVPSLLLSAMAGPDARDPISIPENPRRFTESLEHYVKGTRIAWSRDLGQFQVDAAAMDVIEQAMPKFPEMGFIGDEEDPACSGAA